MAPKKKISPARSARKAKESVLLRLDLVCAHLERSSKWEPFALERWPSLPMAEPVRDLADWVAEDCPDFADSIRAVDGALVAAAIDAWQNSRGQKARRSLRAPKKMDAVVALLAAMNLRATGASLAVLWSQLCADARVTWRTDDWFREWGTKKAASSRD